MLNILHTKPRKPQKTPNSKCKTDSEVNQISPESH